MQFENSEQYANHIKNYCVNTSYANMSKLDRKKTKIDSQKNGIQQLPVVILQDNKNLSQKFIDNNNIETQPKNQLKLNRINNAGQMSLQNLQTIMRSNEPEFKKLEIMAQRKREQEMEEDVMKMKQIKVDKRQQMKMNENQQINIMQFVNKEQSRLLQNELLFKAIQNYYHQMQFQNNDINPATQSEKSLLCDKLLKECGDYMRFEAQLLLDIKTSDISQQKYVYNNYKLNDLQVQEQTEKIKMFLKRIYELEKEEKRIQSNFEYLKLGEFYKMIPRMINVMPVYQHTILDNSIPLDQNPNQSKISQKSNSTKDRFVIKKNLPQNYTNDKVQELIDLKETYMKNGGNDKAFLKKIDDMIEFYQQQALKKQLKQQGINEDDKYNVLVDFDAKPPGTSESVKRKIMEEEEEAKRQRDYELLIQEQQNENLKMEEQLIQIQEQRQIQEMRLAQEKEQIEKQDPYQEFYAENKYFLANDPICVDQDEEERLITRTNMEELDLMRQLSKVPHGTELYRFKLEQFKELSTTNSEVEKLALEQRLQKEKREFQNRRRDEDRKTANEKWIDDQRKRIINKKLRDDLGTKYEKNLAYDANDGFIVHFDFVLGLPKKAVYSQISYGVFLDGEATVPPRLVEPVETEVESSQTVRCIFGRNHQVLDVMPKHETLMIKEVQIPISGDVKRNVNNTESYGWTQLDIFNYKGQLKRGRWKCPLYYGPTEVSIEKNEVKQLEPIPGTWVYLRISYAHDDEFSRQRTLYPDHVMSQYVVPEMHIRNQIPYKRNMGQVQKPPIVENYQEEMINVEYDEDQYQKNLISNNEQQGMLPDLNAKKIYKRMEKPPLDRWLDDGQRHGIAAQIIQVNNIQSNDKLRVMAGVLKSAKLMNDDNNKKMSFNTSSHDVNSDNQFRVPDDQIIPLYVSSPDDNLNSNKQVGMNVKYREEYRFLANFPKIYERDKQDFWLGVQLAQLQDGRWENIGWNYIHLNRENGEIRSGIYHLDLYAPKVLAPNTYDENLLEKLPYSLDVVINEYIYNDKDLQLLRKPPKPLEDSFRHIHRDLGVEEIPGTVKILNDAFIPNNTVQYKTETFSKDMGIDIYIDQLRYLSDKVTCCKIYSQLVSSTDEAVTEQETSLPIVNSLTYSPVYEDKKEIRKPHIDPTSNILFTIVTIDSSDNKLKVVGFAIFPLFINQRTKLQCTNPNDQEIYLNSGRYQIPLYGNQLVRTFPFNVDSVEAKNEKIPCSSLLLRIYRAPVENNKALSIRNTPQEHWLTKKLWIPMPIYGKNIYNNKLCHVNDAEFQLFKFREMRADKSVFDSADMLLRGDHNNQQMDERKILQYLDNKLIYIQNTKMMNMNYFAKYNEQAGLKISIDGLHQIKDSDEPHICFYSIFPPFQFYNIPNAPNEQQPIQDGKDVQLNSNFNWNSAKASPQYNEEYATFKVTDKVHKWQKVHKFTVLIIDVKKVNFTKVDPRFSDVGWVLVPLFDDQQYVRSGSFQVPLIQGPVNVEVLKELQDLMETDDRLDKRDAWAILLELMREKKYRMRFTDRESVLLRILDKQREGHLKNKFDTNRIDYQYLPQNNIQSWVYNEIEQQKLQHANKLSEIIPGNEEKNNYNRKITKACQTIYNLAQYH